jgi:hypothetical protein
LKVRVKRRGAQVFTRDGFYGRIINETASEASDNPLRDAMFSPFQHAGLDVNMLAGYVRDAKAGYLIRSWIHIDAKNALIETEKGARIDLEVLYATSDVGGMIHDSRQAKFVLDLNPEQIAWVKKHGIRFTSLLPVKKPDVYTVHAAVQDNESGKLGSAYQFLVIPAHKKNEMALSDIFMITNEGDIAWMNADVTKELKQGLFFPVVQNGDIRTPALRTYMPGDNLQTMTILYNADAKALAASEIEMQMILYRNGELFQSGESRPVALPKDKSGSLDIIPIVQQLTLGKDQPPGDYVLQLVVTDKQSREPKKEPGLFSRIVRSYIGRQSGEKVEEKGVVTQTLTFTVKEMETTNEH